MNRSLARLSTVNDLEASARYCGALRRRREIQSAEILLRYVMVYALTPFSLRMVGAWGTLQELGSLCKNGVRKRLCQCQTWLGYLIMQLLIQGNLTLTRRKETRVRLFDATTVSQPGSHTADWRLQLGVDLGSGRIT